MSAVFHFLGSQDFVTLFMVLGLGQLIGRLKLGFFSPGSTAGALIAALVVGALAFHYGVRFTIPDLVQTIFLALFTYAVGLRVGPQFVEGMRTEGVQFIVLVMVTTTTAFAMVYFGGLIFNLAPGFAAGVLSGANTISAVMGVATAAVDQGLYRLPAGLTAEQVKANIAAGYSLSYILSILGIVLLVRNLPSMFGFDPVKSAAESEKTFGAKGHALPGTSQAFDVAMQPVDVRVFRIVSDDVAGHSLNEVFERIKTPILRVTRNGTVVTLDRALRLEKGDLVTVGGRIENLLDEEKVLGPEVADETARHLDVDQADVYLTNRAFVGTTLEQLRESAPAYGVRIRALFRDGHELPLLSDTPLRRHDVIRAIGLPQAVTRLCRALGQSVRPTNTTDIITLAFGLATGYAIGLLTVSVAGVPIGLGAMGGVVVSGMVVSTARAINPIFGGPTPEGARAFLESIGVDLFVAGLGLNVAPAFIAALSQGRNTLIVIGLGLATAVVPTFVSWLVGLYLLRMDPMVLAGAVSGARNSTTAMRAISERAKSGIPAFGYPVTYALSTVVFLIYGYIAMLLS